jgi:hypothetical protein
MSLAPVISGFCEVVSTFLRGEGLEVAGDGVADGVGGAGRGFAQEVLELGEELLDGVQVGGVLGRKKSLAPAARTARRTALPRCEPRLSRITTSPGARVGTSTFST